jgi:hypothetical protein
MAALSFNPIKMNFSNRFLLAIILVMSCFFAMAQKQAGGANSLSEKDTSEESFIKFDDTRDISWSKDFALVEVLSSSDNAIQKAYFYKAFEGDHEMLTEYALNEVLE